MSSIRGAACACWRQVADALDTAHDVGLTHRDIKPQNILIGARDHAYLADFGLTKAPDEAGRLTATGQFVGTIDYVSPEQIQGEGATGRSDVYALDGGPVRVPDRAGALPEADRGRGRLRPHLRAASQAHRESPGAAGGHRRGGGEGDGQGAGGPLRLGGRAAPRRAPRLRRRARDRVHAPDPWRPRGDRRAGRRRRHRPAGPTAGRHRRRTATSPVAGACGPCRCRPRRPRRAATRPRLRARPARPAPTARGAAMPSR